ncbi:thiolase family protein [Actinomadura sp. 7K507]|uniref:thiolase family protein n=1 Tax=Actinomadura sp. 7K507 TaxID=2530365 RepID=UPI00104B46BF|nr:thiolase family protein [Actinomadura sp. 7K507]TDC92987.1 thiolase family protein [Actinomadura sp. 7K507]
MRSAVIVDAVRTAGGRRDGVLSGWHPADLSAETLKALIERTGIDPEMIEDVVMGCVTQVGDQSANIARNAVLAAGFPESVPGTTVDRQCGSSQQAVHFAAQGVMAGAYDVVVAAGVELMSTTKMMGAMLPGTFPVGPAATARYADRENYGVTGLPHQGIGAELLADRHGLTRTDLDEFAVRSHELADRATQDGEFANEIIAVPEHRKGGERSNSTLVNRDEGIRSGTTTEILAGLRPAFLEEGRVTAGNASQITDGAAAMLIMSQERAAEFGLRVRARLHSFAVAGSDPVVMLDAPAPATLKVLKRASLGIDDIDQFECNEAFASVTLAWQRETGAALTKVNPYGGAIALGHPLGASGIRLMTTLLNGIERTGGRYGLQTMCEGGGMANATIIEVLP